MWLRVVPETGFTNFLPFGHWTVSIWKINIFKNDKSSHSMGHLRSSTQQNSKKYHGLKGILLGLAIDCNLCKPTVNCWRITVFKNGDVNCWRIPSSMIFPAFWGIKSMIFPCLFSHAFPIQYFPMFFPYPMFFPMFFSLNLPFCSMNYPPEKLFDAGDSQLFGYLG